MIMFNGMLIISVYDRKQDYILLVYELFIKLLEPVKQSATQLSLDVSDHKGSLRNLRSTLSTLYMNINGHCNYKVVSKFYIQNGTENGIRKN